MSDGLLNGLLIIPILAVLILVHEIGHFVAARSVGVKVEEFGIGIPPRLKGWTRNGVIWSINWIPFGGFVRVKGEDANDTDAGSMNAKGPLQRAFFLVAGSTMNFLLAIVLMIVVLGVQGETRQNFYIAAVQAGSPAEVAGWRAGDRIAEVAGGPIDQDRELRNRAESFFGREMSVTLDRDGEAVDTLVVPRENPPEGEGVLGIEFSPVAIGPTDVQAVVPDSLAAVAGLEPGDRFTAVGGQPVLDRFWLNQALVEAAGSTVPVTVARAGGEQSVELAVPSLSADEAPLAALGIEAETTPIFDRVPAGQIIPRGIQESWLRTAATFQGVTDLISGQAPLDQVAGPVGMGQAVSEIVELSSLPLWVTLADLTILLSLNLGLLNLLPLPALDGGRLLFVLVEVLRGGRRIAPEREGFVHLAGFVLLIGLMLLITFADIGRLFSGESFLPR